MYNNDDFTFVNKGGYCHASQCSTPPCENIQFCSHDWQAANAGDVYTGEFRHNTFHRRGTYQFVDLDSKCTVGYEASWEFGKRVGEIPKLHMVAGQSARLNANQSETSAKVDPHKAQYPSNLAPAQKVLPPSGSVAVAATGTTSLLSAV